MKQTYSTTTNPHSHRQTPIGAASRSEKQVSSGNTNDVETVFDLKDIAIAVEAAARIAQVRTPRSRPHGPRVVIYNSIKSREFGELYSNFILEGRPEGYAAVKFDFDPVVKVFSPQPFSIRYFDGRQLRIYTPDFLVVSHNGRRSLIEVKPRQEFEQPHVKAKLAAVETGCKEAAIDFVRLTAEELSQQPRLDNLLLLHPYLARTATQLDSLIEILHTAGRSLPWQQILKTNPRIHPEDIAHGLAMGSIRASHQFRWGPNFNLATGAE